MNFNLSIEKLLTTGTKVDVNNWDSVNDMTNTMLYYGKLFVNFLSLAAFIWLTADAITTFRKSGDPDLEESQQNKLRKKGMKTAFMAVFALVITVVIFVFAKDLGVQNVQKL